MEETNSIYVEAITEVFTVNENCPLTEEEVWGEICRMGLLMEIRNETPERCTNATLNRHSINGNESHKNFVKVFKIVDKTEKPWRYKLINFRKPKNLNLNINGSLALTIVDTFGVPLRNTKSGIEIEKSVFENLQLGEYIINLKERLIYDLNNLEEPIYKFTFEVNEETEYSYDFDQVE